MCPLTNLLAHGVENVLTGQCLHMQIGTSDVFQRVGTRNSNGSLYTYAYEFRGRRIAFITSRFGHHYQVDLFPVTGTQQVQDVYTRFNAILKATGQRETLELIGSDDLGYGLMLKQSSDAREDRPYPYHIHNTFGGERRRYLTCSPVDSDASYLVRRH